MAELFEIGESRYEVRVDGWTIEQVWNWHGSWVVQVRGETYYGCKSRKKAVERVVRIHALPE